MTSQVTSLGCLKQHILATKTSLRRRKKSNLGDVNTSQNSGDLFFRIYQLKWFAVQHQNLN